MKQCLYTLSIFFCLMAFLSGCAKSDGGGGTGSTSLSKISVNDISQLEGTGTSTVFAFTISLDKASSKPVSVTCTTADGSAKAGDDYVAASQTISFAANETQKTFSVTVSADDIKEADEDFNVTLSNPVNAIISDANSSATITNDDTKVPFSNAGYNAPSTYPGYALAWSDEFNGTAVNTVDWTFENGDGCPGVCGWGNNELEFYRPENTFFQDGKMIIEAKKENFSGRSYTSSKLVTRGKKTFKFGRIDIRAILPKGQGIWPAFWMLSQNETYGTWPKSGELDIMEMVGTNAAKTFGTLHFGPGPGSTQLGGNYTLPSGIFNDSFHVFSIEWKQDEIKWLVDGVVFSTHTKSEFGNNNYPFNEDFFFIFNLAVGGNFPGNPDATSTYPQWLIVDYVRVYQ